MSPVGVLLVDATAMVRFGSPSPMFFASTAVSRSKARMQSAEPGLIRFDDSNSLGTEPQMRRDGPGLLAQAGLVESFCVQAAAQRSHREHLVHRHDPGAADSGQKDVVNAGDWCVRGVGNVGRARPAVCGLGAVSRVAPP